MADNDNKNVDPNTRAAVDVGPETEAMSVSIGGKKDFVEKEGVKQRGSGAATKGFTSRGPLA